jgi:hypothetical protein
MTYFEDELQEPDRFKPYPEFDNLFTAIAEALGDGWRYERIPAAFEQGMLIGPNVSFRASTWNLKNGRVRLTWSTPHAYNAISVLSVDDITVSLSKSPSAIAKDITSRLLPHALTAENDAKDKLALHVTGGDLILGVKNALASVSDKPIYWYREVEDQAKVLQAAYGQIGGGDNSIDFRLSSSSVSIEGGAATHDVALVLAAVIVAANDKDKSRLNAVKELLFGQPDKS